MGTFEHSSMQIVQEEENTDWNRQAHTRSVHPVRWTIQLRTKHNKSESQLSLTEVQLLRDFK